MKSTNQTPMGRFLYINGLLQRELAEFLGTTTQYVSLLCKDERVPTKIYSALINNDRGWDITPLQEIPVVSVSQTTTNGDNSIGVEDETIDKLLSQLKAKDAQIERLLGIIEQLTNSK